MVAELQSNARNKGSQLTHYVNPSTYIPLPTLNLIFIRLDSQVTQIGRGVPRRLTSPELDDASSGYGPALPPVFSSLEEARNGRK